MCKKINAKPVSLYTLFLVVFSSWCDRTMPPISYTYLTYNLNVCALPETEKQSFSFLDNLKLAYFRSRSYTCQNFCVRANVIFANSDRRILKSVKRGGKHSHSKRALQMKFINHSNFAIFAFFRCVDWNQLNE